MRIALGLHSLQLGGSQINTVDLASELRQRGHSVHLFAIDHHRYRATIVPIASEAGFEIDVLPAEAGLTAQARHMTRLVDQYDADVVHVFHENHVLGPVAAIAMRARPRRAVVVTNWMMENSRWLPRHAPLIVGTEALRREAAGVQRGPVWLIEPPVHVDRDRMCEREGLALRRTLGIADDEVLAAIVSRVDRTMKLDGITCAIRAVQRLDDPRLRLVIVGDGDAADDVGVLAEDVNRELRRRAVMLTGSMTDPRPAYSCADVVLGMGGSALRGLALGKPVVVLGEGNFARTFTEATAPYFLEHGFYGHGEADLSGTALSAEIRPLLDPTARQLLGELGERTIRDRFALQHAATKLEHVYEEAMRSSVSAAARWSDAAYVVIYHLLLRAISPGTRSRLKSVLGAMRSSVRTAATRRTTPSRHVAKRPL